MISNPCPVLVVDLGAQYAQLIAQRVRGADVYSEIVPHTASAANMLAKDPAAVVFSGGPSSVYEEGAPSLDPAILDAGAPILGICYGFRAMTQALGGAVGRTGTCEYGHTEASVTEGSCLFDGTPADQTVQMSHDDAVQAALEGFEVTTSAPQTPVAAFENRNRKLFGLQWHPEVEHSAYGQAILKNSLYKDVGFKPVWMPGNIVDEQVEAIKRWIGETQVICTPSGGVNSSVAAAPIRAVVGDRLTRFFINHGLLCAERREQVERDYAEGIGIRVVAIDESQRFLDALNGANGPEARRRITGREFIRSFKATQARLIADIDAEGGEAKFPVRGTLYPSVVESGDGEGAVNIKSHHNVGGPSEDMALRLIEPLRVLFEGGVHTMSRELGVPEKIVAHQPFSGPDPGTHTVGGAARERLEALRAADLIVCDKLTTAELDKEVWQCPAVLLADTRSVGVQGDRRTYGHPIALRPASSEGAMAADQMRLPYDVLARTPACIANFAPEVDRVVLDCTSKSPGTAEWE